MEQTWISARHGMWGGFFGGRVDRAAERRRLLQKRLANVIETIRSDSGDISLRELCRRADLPISTMSRAQRGDADVSFLEMLLSLARVWPKGDLWTLLERLLPEEEAGQVRAGVSRSALSPETQAAIEKALTTTGTLSARVYEGDLQALLRLIEALGPALEAVQEAANAVAMESLVLRSGEGDLDSVLGLGVEQSSDKPADIDSDV